MPSPWMPGLIHDPGSVCTVPGRPYGYGKGLNRMERVKVHMTAGTNSYERCKNGTGTPWGITLCQILYPKVGVPWQFAPIDALCYDSGDFNDDGPGLEIEALETEVNYYRPGLSLFDGPNDNQRFWIGETARWLHSDWGTPLDLYAGPRFGSDGFRGFVNHGDLDSQRRDGLSADEWARIIGAPTVSEEFDMLIVRTSDGHREAVIDNQFFSFRSLASMPADRFVALDPDEWDYLHNALVQPPTAAGGAAQYVVNLSGTAVAQ